MKRIALLLVCSLVGILFVCSFLTACSSCEYRADFARLADEVEASRLRRHVDELTALGSRRAGDAAVGLATIEYLESELESWGVATERETFLLTPSSKATLIFGREEGEAEGATAERELPGTYFPSTISQSRVFTGFVKPGEVLESFRLSPGEALPVEQINLMATIPGTLHPDRILEISAHHDTVPGTVGADDNTSGVAVLLEVARLLRSNPPECTVRLCFFAAEELGLLGAREHVNLMKDQNRLDAVYGLINLDTVGFFTDEEDSQESPARIPLVVWPPRTGNFLAIVGGNGSADLAHLVEYAGETYAPDLPLYTLARLGGFLPDARRSDHAPYWDVEIPAVFLTDTAEFRSDRYHRPTDDVESLDFEALRHVAAVTLSSALVASSSKADE